MEIKTVSVEVPSGCNIVIGHAHFIKTVEDLYEALIESGTAIKFGVAFCEASAKRLVRSDGNDIELIKQAEKEAMKIAAGHTFVILLKNGFPINVLNRIKGVSEVCKIHAATANPVEVVIAETRNGRGVLGVVDGSMPLGIEKVEDKKERVDFIRKIGYKR